MEAPSLLPFLQTETTKYCNPHDGYRPIAWKHERTYNIPSLLPYMSHTQLLFEGPNFVEALNPQPIIVIVKTSGVSFMERAIATKAPWPRHILSGAASDVGASLNCGSWGPPESQTLSLKPTWGFRVQGLGFRVGENPKPFIYSRKLRVGGSSASMKTTSITRIIDLVTLT